MRARPIIALIIFLTYSTVAYCQEDFGVLYWTEDRDLEWSDFKGTPLVDSSGSFFLDLYIESILPNTSSWYISRGYEPKIYIFTNTSFADPEVRTDDLLRYFNVYYDLAAVYTKRMVVQLNRARNSEDEFFASNLDIVKNAIIEEWRTESARLILETQYGVEVERLLIWEKEVKDKLDSKVEPIYSFSDYSFSFDLTLGSLVGLNEYDEFLTSPTVGVVSVEVAKAPFTYSFGLSGGGMKVKKSFLQDDEVFPADTEPNILNLFLHSGYQLINSRRWSIIPRVGLHFSNLRYPNTEDLESSVWDIFFMTALSADLKLYRWEDKKNRSYSDIALRFGGYYYPMRVGDQNISHTLLTVGFAWIFGSIDVSYPLP